MQLGIIGCGQIAEFHAVALRAVGFNLTAVCSQKGSLRPASFAKKYSVPFVCDGVSDLLSSQSDLDAILIAASHEATLGLLYQSLEKNIPILVEKPVSLNSADLFPFINQDLPVIVGYNRRFYPTIQKARQEVASRSPLLGHLSVPESISVNHKLENGHEYLRKFFSNSIHGLEVLRFIFGEISIAHVERITNNLNNICGLAAILTAPNGSIIQFTANWNTPTNWELVLDSASQRLKLCPLESGVIYNKMKCSSPTPESPIRKYTPVASRLLKLSKKDQQFKPGFYAQAQALRSLVRNKKNTSAARLIDAYKALQLAEELIGGTF